MFECALCALSTATHNGGVSTCVFPTSTLRIGRRVGGQADTLVCTCSAVKFPMCAGSEDRPPPARSSTKFVGLANQGATCYLNSLLQTCFMTPELRDALFAVGPQDMHYNGPLNGNEWLDGTSDLYMPCELQRLLAYMEAADVDGLQTDALTHSFGWSNVDSNVQQDLQELMRILFDNLEQNLPELDKNRIRSIYTFTGVQEVRCLKCQNRSVREESCGDFNITVDGFKSLTDSLNAWCAPETFSGDNKYRCDKCNAYVEARKQMRLRHLSEVMILSLGRFRYNWQIGGVREKITDRYTFPQELDFAPYLENPVSLRPRHNCAILGLVQDIPMCLDFLQKMFYLPCSPHAPCMLMNGYNLVCLCFILACSRIG